MVAGDLDAATHHVQQATALAEQIDDRVPSGSERQVLLGDLAQLS